jgi:hypothetical protein
MLAPCKAAADTDRAFVWRIIVKDFGCQMMACKWCLAAPVAVCKGMEEIGTMLFKGVAIGRLVRAFNDDKRGRGEDAHSLFAIIPAAIPAAVKRMTKA